MIEMIETTVKTTEAWQVAPQQETPYAVMWLDDNGTIATGRVVGKRWMRGMGECYVVVGSGVNKYGDLYPWLEDVSIDDVMSIGGAWVYPQDVDSMLWARWDDGSESEALGLRLRDFEFYINGLGSYINE